MPTENPYTPPHVPSSGRTEFRLPKGSNVLVFAAKWFRVVLGCAVVASPIAAIVILVSYTDGSYVDALFDMRPRRAGRMIVDGPVVVAMFSTILLLLIRFSPCSRNINQ